MQNFRWFEETFTLAKSILLKTIYIKNIINKKKFNFRIFSSNFIYRWQISQKNLVFHFSWFEQFFMVVFLDFRKKLVFFSEFAEIRFFFQKIEKNLHENLFKSAEIKHKVFLWYLPLVNRIWAKNSKVEIFFIYFIFYIYSF